MDSPTYPSQCPLDARRRQVTVQIQTHNSAAYVSAMGCKPSFKQFKAAIIPR